MHGETNEDETLRSKIESTGSLASVLSEALQERKFGKEKPADDDGGDDDDDDDEDEDEDDGDDDSVEEGRLGEAKFGAGGAGGYAVEIGLGLQKLDHSIKGAGTGFKKGSVEGDIKVTQVADGSFRVEVKTHGRKPASLMFTTRSPVNKVATSKLPKQILDKLIDKDAFAGSVEEAAGGIKTADGISVGDSVIVTPSKGANSMTKGPLKGLIGEVDFIQSKKQDDGGHLAWVKFRGNANSSASHVSTKDLKPYKAGPVSFSRVGEDIEPLNESLKWEDKGKGIFVARAKIELDDSMHRERRSQSIMFRIDGRNGEFRVDMLEISIWTAIDSGKGFSDMKKAKAFVEKWVAAANEKGTLSITRRDLGESLDEGASPGARSKGTGHGRGETRAAGEFWGGKHDKQDAQQDRKKRFNKAQRQGKGAHIDASAKGENLSDILADALEESDAV